MGRFRLRGSSVFSSARKTTTKNGMIAMGITTMTPSYPDYYLLAEDVRARRIEFVAPHDDTFVIVLMNQTDEDIEVTFDCAVSGTADEG